MSNESPSLTQRLRSEFADDPEMREIIDLFVGEMPERIRNLRAAWESRELDRLRRLTHQLKGAGAGYGFALLGDAAGRLEHTLASTVEQGSAAALPRLHAEFDQLLRVCQQVSGPDAAP